MAELEVKVTVMDSEKVKKFIKRMKKLRWRRANRYAQLKRGKR